MTVKYAIETQLETGSKLEKGDMQAVGMVTSKINPA